jgi:hypothetical protein
MTSLVENIVRTLTGQADVAAVDDALLNAAFLFEKSRGLPPCGWPDEVVAANITRDEVARLQRAVVAYVERNGFGSWALGKCFDPALRPVLVTVLRRQLDGDTGELFQAMIALDNLGEPVFAGVGSRSILDESRNRELAREYLSRYGSGDAAAG